jgi:hypothetical protein
MLKHQEDDKKEHVKHQEDDKKEHVEHDDATSPYHHLNLYSLPHPVGLKEQGTAGLMTQLSTPLHLDHHHLHRLSTLGFNRCSELRLSELLSDRSIPSSSIHATHLIRGV